MSAPRFRDYADYLEYLRNREDELAEAEEETGLTEEQRKDIAAEARQDALRDEDLI